MPEGWIKLHRQFLEWEWHDDPYTSYLFIYLILKANYADQKWKGRTIKRGQLVTGRKVITKETGISEQSVRTSLNRLKSTSEITIKSTNRYSIITITNYDTYQGENNEPNQQTNQQTNQQLTSNQPATNQQLTTSKEVKKLRSKEVKAKTENHDPSPDAILLGTNFYEATRRRFKGVVIRLDSEIIAADKLIQKYGLEDTRRAIETVLNDDRPGFCFRDTIRTLKKLDRNWTSRGRKWILEILDFTPGMNSGAPKATLQDDKSGYYKPRIEPKDGGFY